MLDTGRKKPGSSRLFASTPQRQKHENKRLPRSQASVVWRTSAASTRFPKFVTRLRIFANELRKAKGTSKPMMLVPLFDLKFLFEFAAGDAGTSNRRH
jgi:hypothetical protein